MKLSKEGLLRVCSKTLEEYGRGEIESWPRQEESPLPLSLSLFMPARIGDWEGFKLIRERPSESEGQLGPRSAWLVVRERLSKRAWLLDAGDVTDARTGAAGVLAAAYLAPPRPVEAAVIGTGRVARALIRCLDAARRQFRTLSQVQRVKIYSRSVDRRRGLCDSLGPEVGLSLAPVDSAEEGVTGTPIILIAAAAATPVFGSAALSTGTHVSALSGSPFSGALDPEVLLAAQMVVLDQEEQCFRSGELKAVVEQGRLDQVHFARVEGRLGHLGDAAVGRLARHPGDLTVAYLSGLALLDLAVGKAEIEAGGGVPVETVSGEWLAREEIDPWRPIP